MRNGFTHPVQRFQTANAKTTGSETIISTLPAGIGFISAVLSSSPGPGKTSAAPAVIPGLQAQHDYPDPLRRIGYCDTLTGKSLVFLTNKFTVQALTVAQRYRGRWHSLGNARFTGTCSTSTRFRITQHG